jgi:hypothetical protein
MMMEGERSALNKPELWVFRCPLIASKVVDGHYSRDAIVGRLPEVYILELTRVKLVTGSRTTEKRSFSVHVPDNSITTRSSTGGMATFLPVAFICHKGPDTTSPRDWVIAMFQRKVR